MIVLHITDFRFVCVGGFVDMNWKATQLFFFLNWSVATPEIGICCSYIVKCKLENKQLGWLVIVEG